MHSAYLCNMTLDMAGRSSLDPASVIKTSAILNDVVFFDKARLPGLVGMDCTVAEMVAGWAEHDEVKVADLVRDRRFLEIFQSSEEVLPLSSRISPFSEENRKAERNLRPKMIERVNELGPHAFGGAPFHLISDSNSGVWQGIPTFVVNDILNFRAAKENDSDLVGIFSPLHFLSQSFAPRSEFDPEGLSFGTPGSIRSNFPDFGLLTWPEIFELRLDPSIKSFRAKIREMHKSGGVREFTDDLLSKEYLQDLAGAFDRRRPNPLKSFWRGMVGNWPLPISNPVGWLFALADFRAELKDFDDFNWLHFVSETKKAVGERGADKDRVT